MKPFATLTADCPWQFNDKLPGAGRGAAKNYRVQTLDHLRALPLPPLLDDCYLFFWRVSSMVEEAYSVVRAWGFEPKSEIVWEKLTKKGLPWFGMGRHVRAAHETAIVAVRGRPQRLVRNIRSRFAAPVPRDTEGRYVHSAKPEEFYTQIVEKLAGGPYAELFGRRHRPGWTVIGDEAWGPPAGGRR